MSVALSSRILKYWFHGIEANQVIPAELYTKWFNGGKEVDEYISEEFGTAVDEIWCGTHNTLKQSATGLLSMVIALDQFPRNMYRNTAKMFAYDPLAFQLATSAVELMQDKQLSPMQRGFLYLPYEHAETLTAQQQSVELYENLLLSLTKSRPEYSMVQSWLKYAQEHHDLIARFGRFPHRNRLLNRESTLEEQHHLKSVGDSMYGVNLN